MLAASRPPFTYLREFARAANVTLTLEGFFQVSCDTAPAISGIMCDCDSVSMAQRHGWWS